MLKSDIKKVLLPYQWDWIQNQNSKLVALKSRRTGFTWAQALKMVIRASLGVDQNIISHTEGGSKLVIQDVAFWVHWLADRGHTKITDWDVQILIVRHRPTGAVIRSLACVPTNIRGKKGDVFIDEAAWIPNLELMVDACKPLSMWGGRISLVSTSNPYNPYWNRLLKDKQWSVSVITLPTAVEQGLYDRIRKVAGSPPPTQEERLRWVEDCIADAGDAAGRELLCETDAVSRSSWVTGNTQFSDVPVVSLDRDSPLYNFTTDVPHIIGVDIGTESAPTSITVIGVGGRLLACYLVRKHRLPEIEVILAGLVNSSTAKILVDTNGLGRGVGEHLKDQLGSQVQFCPNDSKWINTNLVGTLGGIWSGKIEISRDPIMLEDLGLISIVGGKVQIQEKSSNGLRSHGDTIISLAIAHTGLPALDTGGSTFWDL